MGSAVTYGVVETLLAALQSTEVRKLFHRNEFLLHEFERSVISTKRFIHLDVELWEYQVWMEELKAVLYDADDCLDGLLNNRLVYSALPATIMRRFNKLDALLNKAARFGLDPMLKNKHRSRQTCFYVEKRDIIGREADKEAIVTMLLSHSYSESTSSYVKEEGIIGREADKEAFVAIVGMAGLGKTALAQLVYNDRMIKEKFDLRLWVCVADHSEELTVNTVLVQILRHFDRQAYVGRDEVEQLEVQVGKKIQGKRFLLVLDDVWCEDPRHLDVFGHLLNKGGRGSRILVTTRSMRVAHAFGDTHIHVLQGLSDEDSWNLFKMIAFRPGDPDIELAQLGKEVNKKCANHPLPIKVIGSILYGQDKSKWLSFETPDLVGSSIVNEHLMSELRLSYDHLTPILRICFGFCSIFPKDYVIQKEVLISMWLAQGYLDPGNESKSMEEIGEEYCSILLSRCFFQDIELDEYGEIISFKMHVLMYSLAQEVAGKECVMLLHANIPPPTGNICHLSVSDSALPIIKYNPHYFSSKTLRTFFNLRTWAQSSLADLVSIISLCERLRLLDLSKMAFTSLPHMFGGLPHLKYLDLSDNGELEMLSSSIVELHSLRVLRLCGCKNLKELPENFSTLTNLRYLNIDGCSKLRLPVHTLTMSVEGGNDHRQINDGSFVNWNSLVGLRGDFLMKMGLLSPSNMPNIAERVYTLKGEQGDVCRIALMPVTANPVGGLVSLTLSHIHGLRHLTRLSQLSHLKHLHLRKMWNVEYIESNTTFALMSRATEPVQFFSSLEELVLEWMPNLKGWWRDLTWKEMEAGGHCFVDGNGRCINQLILPSFPCLRDLSIHCCPAMRYFPPCPHVKSLELKGVNEAITFCMKGDTTVCLEKLIIYYNARLFESVIRDFIVPGTADITMKYFYEEQNLRIAREAFQKCISSLEFLSIDGFYHLKSMCGGIEHLTNLRFLSIIDCPELDLEEVLVEVEEGMPWKSLQSLSTLFLDRIKKLVNLPKGFRYMTSLHTLYVRRCKNLEALGESLCSLTSLKFLCIEDCNNLKTLPECVNTLMSLQTLRIENCPKLELAAPVKERFFSEV